MLTTGTVLTAVKESREMITHLGIATRPKPIKNIPAAGRISSS
jgi:hypothetical protein